MRAIPVDPTKVTILVVGDARPQLANRDTGEIAIDEATKTSLMNVDVTVIVNGRAETDQLGIPQAGLPPGGFPIGTVVVATDLIAIAWHKSDGRGGTMLKASALRAAGTVPHSGNGRTSEPVGAKQ